MTDRQMKKQGDKQGDRGARQTGIDREVSRQTDKQEYRGIETD